MCEDDDHDREARVAMTHSLFWPRNTGKIECRGRPSLPFLQPGLCLPRMSPEPGVEASAAGSLAGERPVAEEAPSSSVPYHSHPGWDFYRRIGSPKHIVAPMVDQSELPFRLLCRRYGAQLCYTPMIHAACFLKTDYIRKTAFFGDIDPKDRPLIAQFCGDDPEILLAAARHVEPHVDAVDINLGCPQGIAKRGHYGSFLLEEWELLDRIVSTLSKNLCVPVTCKIRLLPSLDDTLELCHVLVRAGCSILTVHGRTKEQKKDMTGPCDWEAIRQIVQAVPVPVFANGGIGNLDDVERCLKVTGAAGVMSSEAVLENPGLFSRNVDAVTGQVATQDDLAEQYMELAAQHPPAFLKIIKAHVHKFLYTGLKVHEDIRDIISAGGTRLEDIKAAVLELGRRRRQDPTATHATSWYLRYRGETDGADQRKSKQQQTDELHLARMVEVEEGCMANLFGADDTEE